MKEVISRLKQIKETVSELSIEKAISEHTKLFINYDGDKNIAKGRRFISPYVLGKLKNTNNLGLRAYESMGDSEHPEDIPGWRLFLVDSISTIHNTDTVFKLRSDYKPNDKGFNTINVKAKKLSKAMQARNKDREMEADMGSGGGLLSAIKDLFKVKKPEKPKIKY